MGVIPDALKLLVDYYGFHLKYKPTNSYGQVLPNGTLVGSRGNVRDTVITCKFVRV